MPQQDPNSPLIFLSAGEASGEHYGTQLIHALRSTFATAGLTPEFFGMGGERMAAAGCERIVKSEDVAVMGITEVIRHLPRIYREFRRLKRVLRDRRPAVAILIDFPDFNLALAKHLHSIGVPVLFFVSPQLWAWKKHRIHQVKKYVDQMLVIFPFEEPFYHSHNVQAHYVGHPLADEPLPTVSRAEFAAQHSLDPAAHWVGLLPGSRIKEIRANLPEILIAAVFLRHQYEEQNLKEPEFIIPLAATLTPEQRAELQSIVNNVIFPIKIHLSNDARATLFHARASIVASGTATVEAALMGNPFVVVYRVSPLTYAIAKRVVKVPHVAMVNLIANQRLVPELIQSDFQAHLIVQQLSPLLLDGPERDEMITGLKQLRSQLITPDFKSNFDRTQNFTPANAIQRVARITLNVVKEIASA